MVSEGIIMEDIEKNAVNTDRNSGTNTSALY